MNSRKYLFRFLIGLLTIVLLEGCEIAGLPLQEDYNFTKSPIQLTLDVSAYDFIESRKNIDMFILCDAIDFTGLADEFILDNRTFILLNDDAWNEYLLANSYTSIRQMSKEKLTNVLRSYIVEGEYTSLDFTTTPVQLNNLYPENTIFAQLRSVEDDSINPWELQFTNGNGRVISVRTSNLRPTNGVCHVMSRFLF